MFPSGAGFVLVFDYMLSDLSSVLRNCDSPLTEVVWLSMVYVLLGCVVGSSEELLVNVTQRGCLSTSKLHNAQGQC